MINNKVPIYVFLGQTACSKTSEAIKLAKQINAYLINADVYQIYQDMPIGTCRDMNELEGIQHFLFGTIKPSTDYSVADFQKDARKIIEEAFQKDIPVILVGGSGLYINSVLFDYSFNLTRDVRFSEEYKKYSNEQLHSLLKKYNWELASKVEANNRRKVEFYLQKVLSKVEISNNANNLFYKNIIWYGHEYKDKNEYIKSVRARFENMIQKGWIQEIENLIKNYPNFYNLPAAKALGYQLIIDNNLIIDENIMGRLVNMTLKLAKKQKTFFKKNSMIDWKSF